MKNQELLTRLGVSITEDLLNLALTHSSFAYENKSVSNERLEFLGDSVLGFIVASKVFSDNSGLSEGDLTRIKNSLVSATTLATVANRLGLGNLIRLGKGEKSSGGSERQNILADAMEAVIGAAFLSGGIRDAEKIVLDHIFPLASDPMSLREFADPKTTLQEKLKAANQPQATYEIASSGPEHDLIYTALCFSGSLPLGRGEGKSKRSAETSAALDALRKLAN